MYDKYFSKEELQQLPLYRNSAAEAEWKQQVAQVRDLMASGAPPRGDAGKELGRRWEALLERDTAGNQAFILQLDTMHENEPSVQRDTGISPQMKAYIRRAIGESQLDVYAKYLTPAEIERMRQHQDTRAHEWPALIESVRRQMLADPSPGAARAQELAGKWFELFQDMVGTDPATVPRFRQAVENEPGLQKGRGMTEEMIVFLRSARSPA